jgi:hypothetical protein
MNTDIRLVNDNIDLLKELYSSGVNNIDLIYIDPPFNKGRVICSQASGYRFNDSWNKSGYTHDLNEISNIDSGLYEILRFLETKINANVIPYLSMIAIRCWYMYKLLSDKGSFYFHCDDTAGIM